MSNLAASSETIPSSKRLCIYHDQCVDGFAAAWIVRKALGDNVEFYAARYQQDPPDVAGRDVILVDFSYKREPLLRMAEACASMLILDHHKSAVDEISSVPHLWPENMRYEIDRRRSGAGIAWDYFFPGRARPDLVNHIEDRDLFRFALANSRLVYNSICQHPYDFSVWDDLMSRPIESFVSADEIAIERHKAQEIESIIATTRREMRIGGYNVPVINAPRCLASDAANTIVDGVPFVASYYDTPQGRVFSLRSHQEDGLDVDQIARIYGGGGHEHAAGFTIGRGWEGEA